jgi:hypothetical protein
VRGCPHAARASSCFVPAPRTGGGVSARARHTCVPRSRAHRRRVSVAGIPAVTGLVPRRRGAVMKNAFLSMTALVAAGAPLAVALRAPAEHEVEPGGHVGAPCRDRVEYDRQCETNDPRGQA